MNDIKDIIEEIKSRSDIVKVISDYIKVQQSGINYKGLCPFHGEKTPSFYINTSKQIYKCFGCGEGGDVINFVMKIENLEFMDAVKLLAKDCGIEINTNMDEQSKIRMEKVKKIQDINTEAARYYFSNLIKEKNYGYEYLRRRGLDDKIIKKFGLGYAPKAWTNLMEYLISKGYDKETLVECGLVTYKKDGNKYYDRFINRVIFPIFDYRGNVIGFGGRVLDDSLPKYLNSPDTLAFNKKYNLYGLNFARKNITDRTVILVEGYMDLISLYQYGIRNVCATLGTALTIDQGNLLKRYVDTVVISYDSDDAGVKATLRAIDILTSVGINVKVLNLKDVKDPDEFIRKYGLEGYQKSIADAVHYIRYKIVKCKENYDLSKDEQRLKFTKESTKIIKGLKSPVDIDYYINFLSSESKIGVESLKKEVYGKSYKSNYNPKLKNDRHVQIDKNAYKRPTIINNGNEIIEKTLIRLLLEEKEIRRLLILKLDENDFKLNENKEILKFIIKNEEMDKITIDKLKSLNLSEDYLLNLYSMKIENINVNDKKSIEEIVKQIKRNKLQNDIDNLLKKQKELENGKSNDNSNAKEVDVQVMEIAIKIVELRKTLQNI
ncbi:DNA primase [Paraclostridium bifermentans]|jgi:DNA primase|uniref:DNA primase n=1 Tax=Paraclostridium bifermentans TaxID=1490 RepID=UPI0011DC7ED9|nr:DNA primase [Paraclostridium bifermentans]MBS5952489.1 DNA primase [Paraclostridium bifermentans]MBS6507277.1 DNA primase [Paraclostridium bifermentans]MBU5287883.1 DNA primase [Paraclostridium bifermentans]MDU3335048.1 DNA primase [Paraclostridium bifermentans]MDU3801779.1 DNA primase [Paraclostridium bifermentans]